MKQAASRRPEAPGSTDRAVYAPALPSPLDGNATPGVVLSTGKALVVTQLLGRHGAPARSWFTRRGRSLHLVDGRRALDRALIAMCSAPVDRWSKDTPGLVPGPRRRQVCTGKLTENRAPFDGSLSRRTVPPCASTRRRTMASPSPVPL